VKRPLFLALAVSAAGLAAGAVLYRVILDDASPRAQADVQMKIDCIERARSFTEYPLLWLGEEFQGYELVTCERRQTPVKYDLEGNVREPATDYFDFVYGECTPPEGEWSCAVPLQVSNAPPCGPALASEVIGKHVVVRGVTAVVRTDSSVSIATDGVRVSIFPPGGPPGAEANALAAAAALTGVNDLAAGIEPSGSLDLDLGESC
jgi:hypothetical protein